MLGRAVVPDGNATGLPLVVHHELGLLQPFEQEVEDAAGLVPVDADDVAGEVGIDKHALAARVGVGADHRMQHRLEGLDGGDQRIVATRTQRLAEPRHLPAVHGAQAFEVFLQPRRQPVVGLAGAGPAGVAAGRWGDGDLDRGAQRRLGLPTDVGMPVVDRRRVFAVGDDHLQFGCTGLALEIRARRYRAEHLGQRHMLGRRDGLRPEEDHLEVKQRLAQFGLDRVGEGLGQVNPFDPGGEVGHPRLGPDVLVAPLDVDQLEGLGIGHGVTPSGRGFWAGDYCQCSRRFSIQVMPRTTLTPSRPAPAARPSRR